MVRAATVVTAKQTLVFQTLTIRAFSLDSCCCACLSSYAPRFVKILGSDDPSEVAVNFP